MTKRDFKNILLSAVDEGLCSLGESSKQAILFHLEISFQLKKENIPSNLTEFKKALEGIFGPGAIYLEKIIVKRLQEKLGLDLEGKTEDFLECVNIAARWATPKGKMKNEDSQYALEALEPPFKVSASNGGSDKSRPYGQTQFSQSPIASGKQMVTEVRKYG